MAKHQVIIIASFLLASVLALALPFFIFIMRRRKYKLSESAYKKPGMSDVLLFALFLLGAVWCIRFPVGYYSTLYPPKDTVPLEWWEELFNSIIHALQTFSMDEDYTNYITTGKDMMKMIFGENNVWIVVYGIYASLLNVVAPIAGGAIVIELVTGVFRNFELKWVYFFNKNRKKYFFSELSEASLALAKSISAEQKAEKPVFVFTDAYVDRQDEKEYELFIEAKHFGAVCVRDDLVHVLKPKNGKREFYLIDENEFDNLHTLMGLLEKQNEEYIAKSYIYLFVQSDAYMQVEKQANLIIKQNTALDGVNRPIIVPVRSYRNLVQKLLVDVPLYEPLVGKKESNKLTVTILGSGIIGIEAFLNIYWLGQFMVETKRKDGPILEQCDLTVNVVSRESRYAFWSKIDYVNPEIRQTIEEDEKTQTIEEDEKKKTEPKTLCYNKKGDKNAPYCKVNFYQKDLKVGEFWSEGNNDVKELLDSDYFIVALGNDADNISISEKLRCYIGKRQMESNGKGRAVVAYAVFNSVLSSVLNADNQTAENNQKEEKKPKTAGIYMHAFGSLDQVYSCDNIYMSKKRIWASETGDEVSKARYSDSHLRANLERSDTDGYENANYHYWANLARAMHVKYKVFSLGWIKTSLFDQVEKESISHKDEVKAKCTLYKKMCTVPTPNELMGDDKDVFKDIESKKHYLAWIEHRRWCAFTRIMGYRHVDVNTIIKATEKHKDMQLRLHSCLVETRLPKESNSSNENTYVNSYILADFDDCGYVKLETILNENHPKSDMFDLLDEVSYTVRTKDFKQYDYYRHEWAVYKLAAKNKEDKYEYGLEDELIKELGDCGVTNPEIYCDHTRFSDVVSYETENGTKYLIPIDAVKSALSKDYISVLSSESVEGKFVFQDETFAPRQT